MSIKTALQTYTRQEGESLSQWFRRVAQIIEVNPLSIKRAYYSRGLREMVETARKYDGKGNLISRTEKLQQKEFISPPDNLELSRVSTNVTTGQQWVIHTKESQKREEFRVSKELIEASVKSLNLSPMETTPKSNKGNKTLILTFTDVHVGMHINNDIYDSGKWNEKELFKALDRMTKEVVNRFDGHSTIIVEDFGDLVDGWDGQTTRGGHALPQNMSNSESFKNAAKFKIQLALNLAHLGAEIIFESVVNDNHGGDFCHITNIHAKEVLSYVLPDVKYNMHSDFISHYIHRGVATIISHGKDKKQLKYGFGVKLDDRAKSHINAYIDRHDLHKYKIRFKKGDSHQQLFDFTNPKFDYLNYMALSPSSEWVSTNFSKGRRGFTIEDLNGKTSTFTTIEL